MNVARGECAKELRLLHMYKSFNIYMKQLQQFRQVIFNIPNGTRQSLSGYLWQEIGEERSHRGEGGKTALSRHFLLNSENYPTN